MKLLVLALIGFVCFTSTYGQQSRRQIEGKVLDAKTRTPLSRATVKVKGKTLETGAGQHGEFKVEALQNDSIEVSHLGYRTFRTRVADITSPVTVMLEDYSLQLRTLTITSKKLNLRQVDKSLRKIKDNLYAYETETTNGMYKLFLSFLEDQDDKDLMKLCGYDFSAYKGETKKLYQKYVEASKTPANKTDTTQIDYTYFPAVNISHEAAVLFCQWFTEQYNNNMGKKKFAKVKFRLPTFKEWQIAALGDPKFQSWSLHENYVGVIIPPDTISGMILKGKKTMIPVNHDILYPWWPGYNYRKKPYNHLNCFLGNFKILEHKNPCLAPKVGYDGWTKMARTASYFPNGMGLYDVVGNVAEMIDEKGKACGGSWNDGPEESTIWSVKTYDRPHDTIGFRVFMEVID